MNVKLIVLLFLSNLIYAQTGYFTTKTLKQSEISEMEAKFNSTLLPKSKNLSYASEDGNLAPPLRFSRKATDELPPCTIHYRYSKKDSIVKTIHYYWKFTIDDNLSQSSKTEQYTSEFDHLVKSMSEMLGEPEPNQGAITKIESPVTNDKTVTYERKVIWKINSKTVTACIVWAENHGESMITSIE